MSIRNKALQWYEKKYGRIDIPIYTSKLYQSFESWPKKSVWWMQIPMSAIDKFSYVHVLCEAVPGKNDFHHLKVPTKFLQENLKKFHTIKDNVDFYLSTDPKRIFTEERGEGNLDFKKFLVAE